MSHSMLGFLQHILNETQYLMDRIKGVTKTEFLGDETLKRALCHRTGIAAPTLCGFPNLWGSESTPLPPV
jgi:hypothetical protein